MTRDVFAVIPARGGSKGIPGKNLVPLAGRPLIAWTIDAARASACIDRLVVSTDDEAIAAAARAMGAEVPFLRPAALARDDTPGVEPILHAIEVLRIDTPWTLVLQPTSPLRRASDIDAARKLAEDTAADAVLGVTAVRQHAAWHKAIDARGRVVALGQPPTARQQLPRALCPNGAIYLCKTEVLRRERTLTPEHTVAYEMPGSRSVDIDIPDDLVLAAAMLGAAHER